MNSPELKQNEWGAVYVKPTRVGLYQFRCEENSRIAEHVAVIERKGELYAHTTDLGCLLVTAFHEGLTKPQWFLVC